MVEIIEKLIAYAKFHLDLGKFDEVYVRNLLLHRMDETEPFEGEIDINAIKELKVPDILIEELKEKAIEKNLIKEEYGDLFACEIMGMISTRPDEFIRKFDSIKENSGVEEALSYFYNYQIKNNYIQKTAIDKNLLWVDNSRENRIEISINLSKPEKKNSDIAKMLVTKSTSYPKCLLCKENIGFSGNLSKAPRQNIRFIPLKLSGNEWFMQYSPYGYYSEHAIVINEKHVPMTIHKNTFQNILDFVSIFPSYFVGSNADLPIVGGSILSHEHYQGGRHRFPVFDSKVRMELSQTKYPDVKASYLTWYNSVIKLSSKNKEQLVEMANEILIKWRKYDDVESEIISHDENGDHSTITPIATNENGIFNLFLILRNNRCNDIHPTGIFHAHKEYHNIKSEGIGLIEAMGLFISPGRLLRQLKEVEKVLVDSSFSLDELFNNSSDLLIHKDMIESLVNQYGRNNKEDDAHKYVTNYVNAVCANILDNTAVFKKDEKGDEAFMKFYKSLGV